MVILSRVQLPDHEKVLRHHDCKSCLISVNRGGKLIAYVAKRSACINVPKYLMEELDQQNRKDELIAKTVRDGNRYI